MKRIISLITFAILLILTIVPAVQADTTVSAFKTFSHQAYSIQYGYKGFVYNVAYGGQASQNSSYDQIRNHDYCAYKDPGFILPDYIGNGSATISKAEMINSSGNMVEYLNGSDFHNGFITPGIWPSGIKILSQKCCSTALQHSPTASYRMKIKSTFGLPAGWTPVLWTDYCTSSSF